MLKHTQASPNLFYDSAPYDKDHYITYKGPCARIVLSYFRVKAFPVLYRAVQKGQSVY